MDCKILRNCENAVFEPHIRTDAQLPFIYHLDVTSGRRICNFHENLELLFFLDGNGQVEYDSRCYQVGPGDLIVVNSYAVHQVVSAETMTYFCLIIDNAFCKYHDVDISSLHFQELIRDESFAVLFQRVMGEREGDKPFRSTALKLTVLEILLLLCRVYSSQKAEQPSDRDSAQQYIRSAVLYIKTNLARKLTVDEIADAVGVSKYHLMRQFKRFTGCTLSAYINLIRCEYAKELLQTGKYKTKEVAALCGFESDAYFYHVFKKQTNALPSAFVKAGN